MYKKQRWIKHVHEQGWKRNDWGAKPIGMKVRTIPMHFGLDSDRDGVPDHLDCRPFDPARHQNPGTPVPVSGTLSPAAIASRQATIQQLQLQSQRNPSMAAQYQSAISRMQTSLPQTNTTAPIPQRPPTPVPQYGPPAPPQYTTQPARQPVQSGAIIPQPQVKAWLPNPFANTWLGRQLGWNK